MLRRVASPHHTPRLGEWLAMICADLRRWRSLMRFTAVRFARAARPSRSPGCATSQPASTCCTRSSGASKSRASYGHAGTPVVATGRSHQRAALGCHTTSLRTGASHAHRPQPTKSRLSPSNATMDAFDRRSGGAPACSVQELNRARANARRPRPPTRVLYARCEVARQFRPRPRINIAGAFASEVPVPEPDVLVQQPLRQPHGVDAPAELWRRPRSPNQ